MKVVDPACGMTIETENAFASSPYKGTIYYFCSAKCKEEFAKDPETSLTMMAEREKTIEAERSKSLEKMMDQVAHEIRNPLTSIGGFTRRMYERLPEKDPNRKVLELVIEDVTRLESLIKQLIELKAIGLPRMEPSNINNIIEEAVQSLGTDLKTADIKVEMQLTDNPPAILADKHKLTTAIGNIISNAVEAMGKKAGVLRISSHLRNEHIEIKVSDTGKGIPEDKLRYIFDPFFTSKIYGPGLGLTLARSIVEEHKGTILVESEPGQGTTVTIRLPLKA